MESELPTRRDFLGKMCGHCGSGNTVVEVYDVTKEGLCLSCGREISLDYLDSHGVRNHITDSPPLPGMSSLS